MGVRTPPPDPDWSRLEAGKNLSTGNSFLFCHPNTGLKTDILKDICIPVFICPPAFIENLYPFVSCKSLLPSPFTTLFYHSPEVLTQL